jgi:competence protein ComEA
MFRTALSLIALGVLVAAQSYPAAAQAKTAAPAATKAAAAAVVVNINTAAAADLESLPGIGAKTAARIIEHRQKNGPFKKVEELMNVRGVGEKNFLKLKARLTVGGAKAEHGQPQQH